MSFYTVTRTRSGGYRIVKDGRGVIGLTVTLWGAKRAIRRDKKGKGPGEIVYRA